MENVHAIDTYYHNSTAMAQEVKATNSKEDSPSPLVTMVQEIKEESSKEEERKTIHRDHHPNGKLSHEHIVDIDNGDSICKLWNADGILTNISKISDKKKTVLKIYWNDKGIKTRETEIKNNVAERRDYYSQGTVSYKYQINEHYQNHGEYLMFHKNGKIAETGKYEQWGIPVGTFECYNEEGMKVQEFIHVDKRNVIEKLWNKKRRVTSRSHMLIINLQV